MTPKLLGRKGLRAHWNQAKIPQCHADRCLHPGVAITYSGPRGPLSLDVGHVVPAYLEPGRTLWAVSETRPEHSACNRAQGSRIAWRRWHAGGRSTRTVTTPTLDTSRAW